MLRRTLVTIALLAAAASAAPTTQPITGRLLNADGSPAAGVAVYRVADGCFERVVDGVVQVDDDAIATRTDADGRFAFAATTRPSGEVFATIDRTAAAAPADAVNMDRPLRLVPFAAVEGVARVRVAPAAGQFVCAEAMTPRGGARFEWSASVAEDGEYLLPAIAGGEVSLSIVPDRNAMAQRRITVRSPIDGPTPHVDLGGGGRIVTAKVAAPPGTTSVREPDVYLLPDWPKIALPGPAWPDDSVEWDKARQEAFQHAWEASDAGKAAIAAAEDAYRERNNHYLFGGSRPDGTIRLDDVPAGKYSLWVRAFVRRDGAAWRVLESRRELDVTAPSADRPDEPLALGELALAPEEGLHAGDAAPPFDFAALDDNGRVRLDDFRGRFVLVHFWATWCGPCRAATPKLIALERRFAGDDRLAIVHVAEDETAAPAQRYVRAEQLGGIHAWSGPSEASPVVRAYGGAAVPTMVLVGADGVVHLSTSDADELAPEVERALATTPP